MSEVLASVPEARLPIGRFRPISWTGDAESCPCQLLPKRFADPPARQWVKKGPGCPGGSGPPASCRIEIVSVRRSMYFVHTDIAAKQGDLRLGKARVGAQPSLERSPDLRTISVFQRNGKAAQMRGQGFRRDTVVIWVLQTICIEKCLPSRQVNVLPEANLIHHRLTAVPSARYLQAAARADVHRAAPPHRGGFPRG